MFLTEIMPTAGSLFVLTDFDTKLSAEFYIILEYYSLKASTTEHNSTADLKREMLLGLVVQKGIGSSCASGNDYNISKNMGINFFMITKNF